LFTYSSNRNIPSFKIGKKVSMGLVIVDANVN